MLMAHDIGNNIWPLTLPYSRSPPHLHKGLDGVSLEVTSTKYTGHGHIDASLSYLFYTCVHNKDYHTAQVTPQTLQSPNNIHTHTVMTTITCTPLAHSVEYMHTHTTHMGYGSSKPYCLFWD